MGSRASGMKSVQSLSSPTSSRSRALRNSREWTSALVPPQVVSRRRLPASGSSQLLSVSCGNVQRLSSSTPRQAATAAATRVPCSCCRWPAGEAPPAARWPRNSTKERSRAICCRSSEPYRYISRSCSSWGLHSSCQQRRETSARERCLREGRAAAERLDQLGQRKDGAIARRTLSDQQAGVARGGRATHRSLAWSLASTASQTPSGSCENHMIPSTE